MQSIVKAVIFDLDGVIVDSNPAIEGFWKSWTDNENIYLDETLIRQWIHGRKVGDTLTGLFNHLTDQRKKEIERSAHEFDRLMKPSALPGIINFVTSLNAMGIPTGVVTSSHHSRMLAMLTGLEIENYFGYFVTAHDVLRGKPDPEPYLTMSEKMKIPNTACLVFEDAISGIQSAVAAGMFCIGIGNETAKKNLVAQGAVDVIPDFSHLHLTRDSLTVPNGCVFRI